MTSFVASFVLIRYRLIAMKDRLPLKTVPANRSPSSTEKPYVTRFESAPGAIEATHTKDSMAATHINGPPLSQQSSHVAELTELLQTVAGTVSELEGRVFVHQVETNLFSCFGRSKAAETNNGVHVDPPVRLLSRCHNLSVTMALLGFVLALLGILTFAWTALPTSVSIFSSVCLAGCVAAVLMAFNFP